jgi:hypothetical protein
MLNNKWKLKNMEHWGPRYIYYRVNRYFFEKSHPLSPNLAIGAIHFLDDWLKKTDVCLEYGAGHSTAWFAQRVGKIISIENRRRWYEEIRAETDKYPNVELLLLEPSGDMVPGCEVSWDYVNKAAEFSPETFDFVLNDGWARSYVGIRALPFLKKGGIFCWDDWAYSFPGSSHIPGVFSRNTKIKSPPLREFWSLVKDWRQTWVDDGVHSTAIFFKPV